MQTLNKKYIVKINDEKINDYLDARNLKFNRDKMINKKKISSIEHYAWWFKNKRNIFFYETNKDDKIYFWDQIFTYQNKSFIAACWHSNFRKTNLYIILFLQKWQISRLKSKRLPWIAVVKKNNKIVYKLCNYLGYIDISKDKSDVWYKIIKNFFGVNSKDFYFLKLNSN